MNCHTRSLYKAYTKPIQIYDSLLSGSSGRTGRVVVANVSGTEILRARPRKSSKPATLKQVLVRQRMKLCYDFILPYKSFASLYFGIRVGMRSSYNQAITNLLQAFKIDYVAGTVTPEYSAIEFARGSLLGIVPTGLSSAAGKITLDWYNNSGGNPDREADLLQILYCADGDQKPVFLENMASRLETTVEITLPPSAIGKQVNVWAAFRTDDLADVSLSVYAGAVVIA